MRKAEQAYQNDEVMAVVREIAAYSTSHPPIEYTPLRTCKADVTKLGRWYLLRSYATIVAAIDTTTVTLYDFSRYAYGYTATTAQHIAKFGRDYGAAIRMTYREI